MDQEGSENLEAPVNRSEPSPQKNKLIVKIKIDGTDIAKGSNKRNYSKTHMAQ